MSEPRYTHGHHASVLASHRWRTAANSAAYLIPHLRPGMALLDVGAGPGTITTGLAEIVAPGRVTALETSEETLGLSRAEAAARWIDNVDFAVGDVHALDFPDASFDVVHAHNVLQHVADPIAALAEMRRVAKPGGIVAVRESDYAGFTWYPRLPELDHWMTLYLQVARANGGEPNAGRHLLAWAHAAGLTDVTAGAGTWCFANPGRARFWGGMWAERILHSAIATQIVDDGYGTTDDLEAISAAWEAWASHPDAYFTTIHGEIICRI